MCPISVDDLLVALIVPGPKLHDLIRDGRYAMHSFPAEQNEDAFYITGKANELHEPDLRRRVEEQFIYERSMSEHPLGIHRHRLFRFNIELCLHTVTAGHGTLSLSTPFSEAATRARHEHHYGHSSAPQE